MKKKVAILSALMLSATAASAFAGDAALGKQKYDIMCASCHGTAGKGDGPAGGALNPKPRDLTDQAWQKATTDDKMRTVITKGGAAAGLSPMMPPLGASMKPAEVDGLIAYIRTLK